MTGYSGRVSLLTSAGAPIEAEAVFSGHQTQLPVDESTTVPGVRSWRGRVWLFEDEVELVSSDDHTPGTRLADAFWQTERIRVGCIGENHPPGELIIIAITESYTNSTGLRSVSADVVGTGPPPWPAFPPEHRRDPSWRCTKLDPFTARDHRDGIGTYRRCPACEAEELELIEKLGHTIRKREP